MSNKRVFTEKSNLIWHLSRTYWLVCCCPDSETKTPTKTSLTNY